MIFLIEIYKGSKNPIKAELFLRARFLCNFQSIDEDYPFGIDNCNFYIYLKDNQNGVVKLKLKQSLTDFGPSTVSAFRIVGWKAAEGHLAAKEYLKAISVEVTLKLRFFSIFMVTYLPTILMNVINQATNYITGGIITFTYFTYLIFRNNISDSKYDLVYTINITSMMVLASIYLSVSTSLPSTPTIKPVEIWLLFNLFYPFLVMIINIFLQVCEFILKLN